MAVSELSPAVCVCNASAGQTRQAAEGLTSGARNLTFCWRSPAQGRVKVLLLEAGEKFDRNQFWSHVKPWEASERRRRGESPPDWYGTPVRESPYETLPGKQFWLGRVWGVGGKTNIWGRVSFRYSDLNFQEPAKDGWEIPNLQRNRPLLRQRRAKDRRLRRR